MENFNDISTLKNITFGSGYRKLYTITIPYGYLGNENKGYSFASFDLRLVSSSSDYQMGKNINAIYNVFIKYTDNLVIDFYYNTKDYLNYQNNANYEPMNKFFFVCNKEVLDTDRYTGIKVLTIDIYFELDQKLQYGYGMSNLATTGRITVEDLYYQPSIDTLPESNFDYSLRKINRELNRVKSTFMSGKDGFTNSKVVEINDWTTMTKSFEGYICLKDGVKNIPCMLMWSCSIDKDRYKNLDVIYRQVPISYKDGTLGWGILTIGTNSQLSLFQIDRSDLKADSIDKIYLDNVSYKMSKF